MITGLFILPGLIIWGSDRSFFQAFSVPQRVERMVTRWYSWADTGQHDDFDFIASQKRVSKYHRQLWLTERYMLTLACLPFLRVNSPYTFFKSEKRLVNLCALRLSVLAIIDAIRRPLWTRQIYQKKLAAIFDAFLLNFNLTDSMTPWRSVIRYGRMRRPYFVALVYQVNYLLFRWYELLT